MDFFALENLMKNGAHLVLSYNDDYYQKFINLAQICYEKGVTLTLKVKANDFKNSSKNIKIHLGKIVEKGHRFITFDISE